MQLDHSDIQTGPRQPARETGHAIMRLPYQIRVATQAGAGRAPMAYTRSHHVWHGPHTQRGGTFLGILLGLMLGAGAAAGIAWYIYQSPLPFITPSTPDKGKVVQSAPEVPSPVPSVAAPQGSTLPDPNQGSSRQQVMPQPDPRNVVQSQGVSTVDVAAGDDTAALDAAAPVAPADAPAADAASAAAAPAARGGFLLQAGSFRRQADADRLKGSLALRGLEARVESAAVGGQTVYRVRIGPYGSLDQVNQIRRELADDGIEAAAVRMR